MNALIESLNMWGARFINFAPAMLLQSSLLIALVFAFDFALRRKIRPNVRYALWFVVFVKLLLPPTLALPTGAAWWLRTREVIQQHSRKMTVRYNEPAVTWPQLLARPSIALQPPKPRLSPDASILMGAVSIGGALLLWAMFRWREIGQRVRATSSPPAEACEMFDVLRHQTGVNKKVRLRLMPDTMSPAVCGLFRPVILLPQSLLDGLSPKQLRAVLLHELIHLQRRDVWVNCAQTLLQIVYWWHPLLWFANARVRRLREESVDDAVMIALSEEAEIYAPTLLEVAKLALNRPLAALGLVGILESRNALRHRIERLVNFTTPRSAGLSVVSVICITAFTALAVPMGEPPARVTQLEEPVPADALEIKPQVLIQAHFYQLRSDASAQIKFESASLHREANSTPWLLLLPDQFKDVREQLKKLGADLISSPQIQTSHNTPASIYIGDGTNDIRLDCAPLVHGDVIEITTLIRTTGNYAPNGKGWPDLGDKTNCAIYARMEIPSGDGVLLRAEHAGTTADNLVVLLTAKIVEPSPLPGSPAVRRGSNSSTNDMSRPHVVVDQVGTLLTNGKALYELRKMDEAESKFKQLLTIEPDNQAALYYLSLIKQQRMRAVVDAQNGDGLKPIPNPSVRTNTIHTSAARQKIYEKLNTIKFDSVSYPGQPLTEVIRNLRAETKQRDPDQEGINFVLNRAKPAANQPGLPPAFDPRTGQPITPDQSEDVDPGTVTISLDPGLENVRLMDVLEAIVKTADHPIKYSLLDYGIEFSIKGPDVPELHTRTFKVDPKTFYLGLQNVGTLKSSSQATGGGGSSSAIPDLKKMKYGGGDSTTDIQMAVINFFNAIGVNLWAPKSVFFNDRQGTLTVHATADDLDLIEQAIITLNIKPAEVTIKTRFIEVDPANKSMIALLGGALTNARYASTNSPTVCGLLTEPQLRAVLKALEKRDHADLLNEGEVTTLSGREANFEVVDVKTIVTGFTTPTNSSTPEVNTALTTNGTTLDVVSYVSADGYTIQMTVTPVVTEFLGYADPGNFSKINKSFKDGHPSFPASRVRKAMLSAIVRDGQTLVLGHLSDDLVVNELNGKESRQPYADTKKKQLFVLITTTIIDSSGNRVHTADYYDSPVVF